MSTRKKVKSRIAQIKKDQFGATEENRETMKIKAARILEDLYEMAKLRNKL